MKSFSIVSPLDIRLDETEVPTPGPQELLIRVLATGICSTDIELYEGTMPYLRQGLSQFPLTPGHEWSGVVEAVGQDVSRPDGLSVGDTVVGDTAIGCGQCRSCLRGDYHLCRDRDEVGIIGRPGAMAEYLVMPRRHCYPVPPGISLKEAALVEPLATALEGVRKTSLAPGDRVAVVGDGTIGLLCAQVAAVSGGAQVTVVSIRSTFRSLIVGWGMELVDLTSDGHPDGSSLGGTFDAVFEATGQPEGLTTALSLVRPGGRIGVLSITGKPRVEIDMDLVVTRAVTLFGILGSPNAFTPALNLLASGKIDVSSLITHTFPFERAGEAFEFFRGGSGDRIKIVVSQEGGGRSTAPSGTLPSKTKPGAAPRPAS